eukprot:14526555-Heterocapsa_arctica.AAC.1
MRSTSSGGKTSQCVCTVAAGPRNNFSTFESPALWGQPLRGRRYYETWPRAKFPQAHLAKAIWPWAVQASYT